MVSTLMYVKPTIKNASLASFQKELKLNMLMLSNNVELRV